MKNKRGLTAKKGTVYFYSWFNKNEKIFIFLKRIKRYKRKKSNLKNEWEGADERTWVFLIIYVYVQRWWRLERGYICLNVVYIDITLVMLIKYFLYFVSMFNHIHKCTLDYPKRNDFENIILKKCKKLHLCNKNFRLFVYLVKIYIAVLLAFDNKM